MPGPIRRSKQAAAACAEGMPAIHPPAAAVPHARPYRSGVQPFGRSTEFIRTLSGLHRISASKPDIDRAPLRRPDWAARHMSARNDLINADRSSLSVPGLKAIRIRFGVEGSSNAYARGAPQSHNPGPSGGSRERRRSPTFQRQDYIVFISPLGLCPRRGLLRKVRGSDRRHPIPYRCHRPLSRAVTARDSPAEYAAALRPSHRQAHESFNTCFPTHDRYNAHMPRSTGASF